MLCCSDFGGDEGDWLVAEAWEEALGWAEVGLMERPTAQPAARGGNSGV